MDTVTITRDRPTPDLIRNLIVAYRKITDKYGTNYVVVAHSNTTITYHLHASEIPVRLDKDCPVDTWYIMEKK